MNMIKLLACAAAALSLCLPCSALAISWDDIPLADSFEHPGTPAVYEDVSVTYDSGNNQYTLTGGTISNVSIERDDEQSTVFSFENVTLTGSFSVTASEDDTFCELILGSGVEDKTDDGLFLRAQSKGQIRAYVYCPADVHASAGGYGWVRGESADVNTSLSLHAERGTVDWTSNAASVSSLSITTDTNRVSFSGSAMLGAAGKPLEINITDAGVFPSSSAMRRRIAYSVSEMLNLSRIACRDQDNLPVIYANVIYTTPDGTERSERFLVDFSAQKSPVVSAVFAPVSMPTLVDSAAAGQSLQLMTVSSAAAATTANYYISLPQPLSGDYTLYFPYPSGVNAQNRMFYDLRICHEPPNHYDMNNDGQFLENLEFTDYGIKVTTSSLGSFRVSCSEIRPEGVSWYALMRTLHKALESGSSPVVSCSVDDATYPHKNSNTITVTAEYDRETDTLTVSGGRLGGIHIANSNSGEPYFGEFGLGFSRYVFRDVLLLEDLYIFNEDGLDYTVVLEKSVGGVYDVLNSPSSESHMQGGFSVIVDFLFDGSVTLENNTRICARNGHSLYVGMDCGSKFVLTGKGKVDPGNGWINHPTIEDYEIRDYKTMCLGIGALTDDHAEAIRMITNTLENDVSLPPSQFSHWKNGDCVRTYFYRLRPDREAFDVDMRYVPVHRGSMNDPVFDPTLVLSSGDGSEEEQLLVQETHLGGSIRHYNLEYFSSADAYGSFDEAELYLPYPDGLDMHSAAGHLFTVSHVTGAGIERFSTDDGSIELTPYGLKLDITSLSPYVLSWEAPPDASAALPETGDNSRLPLWLALLSVSLILFLPARKRLF